MKRKEKKRKRKRVWRVWRVWRLPFAVNVNLNLSNLSNDAGSRVSDTQYWENLVFVVVLVLEPKAFYCYPGYQRFFFSRGATKAFRARLFTKLTETWNRAWKVSGTQGSIFQARKWGKLVRGRRLFPGVPCLVSPDNLWAMKAVVLYVQGRGFNSCSDNLMNFQLTEHLDCYYS